MGAGGLERIVDLMGVLVPFVTYLNGVVMPDEESADGGEGEEGEEGEEDEGEGDGEEDGDGDEGEEGE